MTSTAGTSVIQITPGDARAVQAARALGQALGRSPAFRKFEEAQDAFMKADGLSARLERYQSAQRDVQAARAWGGAEESAVRQLEAEWQALCLIPEVQAYLQAQEELLDSCRKVVGRITAGVGIDFARTCAAGACC